MRAFRTALIVTVLFALTAQFTSAQDATGRILGVVSDPTGAVVPGAHVTVINIATDLTRTTLSAEDGSYQALARR
jgi:hypothetical protein